MTRFVTMLTGWKGAVVVNDIELHATTDRDVSTTAIADRTRKPLTLTLSPETGERGHENRTCAVGFGNSRSETWITHFGQATGCTRRSRPW